MPTSFGSCLFPSSPPRRFLTMRCADACLHALHAYGDHSLLRITPRVGNATKASSSGMKSPSWILLLTRLAVCICLLSSVTERAPCCSPMHKALRTCWMAVAGALKPSYHPLFTRQYKHYSLIVEAWTTETTGTAPRMPRMQCGSIISKIHTHADLQY